ncbi:MAG: tetratricopeptide repeat protein [Candidatus Latescibacterota bacterium]|nr:tetratricopeptide repeat protein [Candidatus Latescibacterota bacterium]
MFWLHPEFFSRDAENAMYRPMVLSSLALNYAISGYDVGSYHLLNIFTHSICCYLVFSLLVLIGGDRRVSFVCALFLAIHPLCSQSVNYISSRSELFAALGSVGALWAYVRYDIYRVTIWSVISIIFYMFALFSKSIAIVFPLWIIAYDIHADRSLSLKRYFPYLLFSVVYLIFTKSLLIRAIYNEPVRELTVQLATQCKALAYYIYLIFFPVRQSIDHAFFESTYFDLTVLLGTLFFVSLLSLLCLRKYYLIGVVIAISSLIPTFIVPLNVLINENRLYLPLVGLSILISMFCTHKRTFFRKEAIVVLAICFVLCTSQRNIVWSDEFSLWNDANMKNPFSFRSSIYLGHQLRDVKDFDGALNRFERALELEPGSSIARAGLALTLQQSGAFEGALEEYKKALIESPEMNDLNYNIGLVLQLMSRNEESLGYYRKVDVESPHFSLSLNNSGTLYEKMDMPDSALHYYMRGVKLGSLDARKNIERLNKKIVYQIENALGSNKWIHAEYLSRSLIDLFGTHQSAQFYLVISLFEQNRYGESLTNNRSLIAHFPNFIQGHLQYANVLETVQDFPEAIRVYSNLLEMPLKTEFRNIVVGRLNRINDRDN